MNDREQADLEKAIGHVREWLKVESEIIELKTVAQWFDEIIRVLNDELKAKEKDLQECLMALDHIYHTIDRPSFHANIKAMCRSIPDKHWVIK
jgi:hypothetical protein